MIPINWKKELKQSKEMLAKAQQMEQDIINKANASSSDDLRYIDKYIIFLLFLRFGCFNKMRRY